MMNQSCVSLGNFRIFSIQNFIQFSNRFHKVNVIICFFHLSDIKQVNLQTTTNKYHVFLERINHRGGSFTTEARNAQNYEVTGGSNVYVPELRAATVNSNITPINSYLFYQNNSCTKICPLVLQ